MLEEISVQSKVELARDPGNSTDLSVYLCVRFLHHLHFSTEKNVLGKSYFFSLEKRMDPFKM